MFHRASSQMMKDLKKYTTTEDAKYAKYAIYSRGFWWRPIILHCYSFNSNSFQENLPSYRPTDRCEWGRLYEVEQINLRLCSRGAKRPLLYVASKTTNGKFPQILATDRLLVCSSKYIWSRVGKLEFHQMKVTQLLVNLWNCHRMTTWTICTGY